MYNIGTFFKYLKIKNSNSEKKRMKNKLFKITVYNK